LKGVFAEVLQVKEAQVADEHLNAARNWLKHSPPDDPIDVTTVDAFVMILRAYSKFLQVYGEGAATATMQSFVEQVKGEVSALFKPFVRAVVALTAASHP
jgi:hypothetical protein